MTNSVRGEVILHTDNKGPLIMCVTTGALAKMETELGKPVSQIDEILASSEMGAINSIVYWLLRGGGNHDITKDDMITLSYQIKPAVKAIGEAFKTWAADGPTPKKEGGPKT